MMDMFSFNQKNNEKSIQHNFGEYKKHKREVDDRPSVSLTQGDKFLNYQNRIKNQVTDTQQFNLFSNDVGKEGFSPSTSQSSSSDLNLQKDTNNLLQNSRMSLKDNVTLEKLKKEYEITLEHHEKLQSKIEKVAQMYFKRVNPKHNKYLGKTISIEGRAFYVTNQGVAKFYPSTDIYNNTAGLNGCPSADNVIEVDVRWHPKYAVAGSMIPTQPPLVTGDPMVYGQSCGAEGKNVYVNMPLDATDAKYSGTYTVNTNPPMTFIGGAPSTGIVVQNPNFDKPALSNNSYGYYGNPSTPDASSIPGWTSYGACILNNSSAWGYPTPYPNNGQAASIQMTNAIAQTFTNVETGSYKLTLQACGRNCCDGSGLSNPIDIQLNGTVFYTINVPVGAWTPISTTFTVSQQGTNTITFQGTASTSTDRSTAIKAIDIAYTGSPSATGTYTYDTCAQAAATGYQYFGIQNADSEGKGYCSVTNDYQSATAIGRSVVTDVQTALWSSNTAGNTGAYAQLTSLGALQVFDSTGKSIFTTTATSDSSYWGCYADTNSRAISKKKGKKKSLDDCHDKAEDGGYTLYGWQDVKKNKKGECWVGSDFNSARKYGMATNCRDVSGNKAGHGWSNAVYGLNPGFESFIILQSDGNMCIYRGQSPRDNQGLLWSSDTVKKQKQSNPNWTASTGKYSSNTSTSPHERNMNWMPSGYNGVSGSDNAFVLRADEYFSTPSGRLKLIMQSDGNLVLYTSTVKDNSTVDANGNYVAGANAVSLYDFGNAPDKNAMGKLAYVDGNGQKHLYPAQNFEYGTSGYTVYNNVNNPYGTGSNTAYYNISQEDCENTCNTYPDASGGCYGYIMTSPDASNNTCYIKNVSKNTYPNQPLTPQTGWTTYIKNLVPKRAKYTNDTVNVNAPEFTKYANGQPIVSYSGSYDLAAATAVDSQHLSQIEDRLNQLAAEISKYTNKFAKGNASMLNQAKKNIDVTNNNLNAYATTEEIIKQEKKMGSNLDGILNDSNIVVLQENYNYAVWSILAIGLVVVSMNLVKK